MLYSGSIFSTKPTETTTRTTLKERQQKYLFVTRKQKKESSSILFQCQDVAIILVKFSIFDS